MKVFIRYILLLFVLLFGGGYTVLKASVLSDSNTVKHVTFHFRGGSSVLERDYMSNMASLEALDVILHHLSFIDMVDSLSVSAGASPDGDLLRNKLLAQSRAESIKSYISGMCSALSPEKIKVHFSVTGWHEIIPFVESDTDSPYRSAILQILTKGSDSRFIERQLRQLSSGRAWQYITTHYLSRLRSGDASIVFYLEGKRLTLDEVISVQESAVELQDTVSLSPVSIELETNMVFSLPESVYNFDKQALPKISIQPPVPFIALKTDLLLWAGVMPNFRIGTWTTNISAEVYFARRWSAQVGWAYSNWNTYKGDRRLFAVSVLDLEGRYWFNGERSFKGFFIGANLKFGEYDKQEEFIGHTGRFWSVGLGGGYYLPLSHHWGLEAQAILGYSSENDESYDIEPGHNYFDGRHIDGAFLAQIRLQVVYRFGKPIQK